MLPEKEIKSCREFLCKVSLLIEKKEWLKFWRSFKWEFIKGRKEPKQISELDKQVFREEEDKGTAREMFIKGVKLWEGIYNNQVSKDTGIVYDDFGVNEFVKVQFKQERMPNIL